MKKPDTASSTIKPYRSTTYEKKYNRNISTDDTPTTQHRVRINHDNPNRSTQFPYYN
jgi:hypothetical protein